MGSYLGLVSMNDYVSPLIFLSDLAVIFCPPRFLQHSLMILSPPNFLKLILPLSKLISDLKRLLSVQSEAVAHTFLLEKGRDPE
jgi:hypothetical protein